MELDEREINKLITRLNKETGKNVWIRSPGLYAVTRVELNSAGDANFFPASGVPLVVLINSETGETRTFHINAFRKNDGNK